MLELTTNADELGTQLVGLVDEATSDADLEAADLAYDLVNPKTPRQTGRLAAGLRSVAVSAGGFDLTDPVDYAERVDNRTGFASETIAAAGQAFADLYDRHIQTKLDDVE